MSLASAREIGARARAAAARRADAVVSCCRHLVRIPSPSGGEGDLARRVESDLRDAGADEVAIDTWGNVVGILRANAAERLPGAVLLNAHLDHVDAGELSEWSHQPFDADVADGKIFGRGASDTKSAIAAQIDAIAVLKELGDSVGPARRRDVVVAAVVQEEIGGLGTAGLVDGDIEFDSAVIGEPSGGALAFGHRGRVEVEVTFHGRAAHASRPDWGVNPHPALARFVPLLDELEHGEDARFGRSTVAPTLVHARAGSPNVIPSDLVLTLDWRNVAGETPSIIQQRIEAIAERVVVPGVSVRVRTPTRLLTSWKGQAREIARVSQPFSTDPASPFFTAARQALAEGLDHDVAAIAWDFASDGGWIEARGIPCVGYGPGDMRSMHVVDESVAIDSLVECVAGYALLALALCGRPAEAS